MKVIVPLTDWKARYEIAPWMVKVSPNQQNGLTKASAADCFQIRSVSIERMVKAIGSLRPDQLYEMTLALGLILKINPK